MDNKQKVNERWKENFASILNSIFYSDKIYIKNLEIEYNWSSSTINSWLSGRRLPRKDSFNDLYCYLDKNYSEHTINESEILEKIEIMFINYFNEDYYAHFYRKYHGTKTVILNALRYFYYFANNDFSLLYEPINKKAPTGKTRAIIFDFDGTLTIDRERTNKTTWEMIWSKLGYNIKVCRELHQKFDRNEINHEDWCNQTNDYFCKKHLNKKILDEIASEIVLIDGIEEVFSIVNSHSIKIYIVSGSIDYIIDSVMGNLKKYVTETKSNVFRFDENNRLTNIVGTCFDFEGKARFIKEKAIELDVAPEDILFVGNSINDRFAYESGATTLCINPKLTDTTNRKIWNECIPVCNNLTDILKYVTF